MSLQSELDTFKATWTERVGDDIAQMMSDDNAGLQSLADQALKAGDIFPSVLLQNQLGQAVDIKDLADDGPLIVTFYRGGWCPYCSLELRAYQKVLSDIEQLGARLVAVSPETPDNTLSTSEKNDLKFEVLSDAGGALADALGIRFELSDQVISYFISAGHDLPERNGDGRWLLPIPATYVIEKGGRIALAHVNPDYRTRLEPADALKALEGLRGQAIARFEVHSTENVR